MSSTTTVPDVPAKWRGLVCYQDMEEMTEGRVKSRSFSRYQSDAKARRESGEALGTDMPAPVKWTPNPFPGLPDTPWFKGPVIWVWLGETDRLPDP
jgi:hypothetical protein